MKPRSSSDNEEMAKSYAIVGILKKKKTMLAENKFEILPYAVKAKIFCKISQIETIPQYSLNKCFMDSVSGIAF